jgi:hypothetical protein
VYIHTLLSTVLDGKDQLHAPAAVPPVSIGWLCTVAGREPVQEKKNLLHVPEIELRFLDRTARSPSHCTD